MSVPPMNYSVPPPNLNMPPPAPLPIIPSEAPPPQIYNRLPPFGIPPPPLTDQPTLYLPPTLPPLYVPPPQPSTFPPPLPPIDIHAASRCYPHLYPDYSYHDASFYNPALNSVIEIDNQWKVDPQNVKTEVKSERLDSPCLSERSSKSQGNFEQPTSTSSIKVKYRSVSKDPVPEKYRVHHSPRRDRSYERERSYDEQPRERYKRESKYRDYRSRSPRSHHRSISPLSHRHRDSEREQYYKEKYNRKKHIDERRERDRKYDYKRKYSPHYSDRRSHSRSCDLHEASHDRKYLRAPSTRRCYSPRRDSHSRSRVREMSPHSKLKSTPQKPLTDRENILEEFRKNYCKTSEDLIEKMEQWSKEHDVNEAEATKMWYRCSPAELYYKQVEGSTGVRQTNKLEKLCTTFYMQLIDRGRKARPEVDELPPLKPAKVKMCKHRLEEGSSSSSESDECLDEDGLQGYTDRIMLELQRKQSHPRRLHPEMWFNNTGEMNGGPLCRCSARARRLGMRHGVYAGEGTFPKCVPSDSNINRLYHYRITVSPPTNFLIKAPTIISHDEHEFLFSGFSLFSHYKLAKLPTCKVIRFNIEYTILYVEEPAPRNFTIKELDLFEEYLFIELLELIDLDLGKGSENSCSQFHFMPRFVRMLSEGGCEVLSMCEVLKYLLKESDLLIPPETLRDVHNMDHYTWQKFVDRIKGMIVTYPGKKPCSVRVDQLDRSPPHNEDGKKEDLSSFYPEIVHFGIRPPQLSYAGNPELIQGSDEAGVYGGDWKILTVRLTQIYQSVLGSLEESVYPIVGTYQKAWRYYVKYRHLIANMAKPSPKDRQKLTSKEAKLQEMRTQSKMKRDVTVAIPSEGFHTTGLMCDVVQHAMLIPVLVRHLRFHKSLDSLEKKIGYVFKQRQLLQTALTHPSYRENFGTNPDHARNSLTNCGIRQPEYGDRRIHYTRKKGSSPRGGAGGSSDLRPRSPLVVAPLETARVASYQNLVLALPAERAAGIVTLINIMSRFGKLSETESVIKHNERLEFLGDAVVEFLSSIHLFRMFPGLAEGGLATYRASIVQNQHLAQLAKNIELEQFMLYAHGSDLCREVVMRHAMANCFEALMGALFLDAELEVADRVFSLALWYKEKDMLEVWSRERAHPLQEQEPLGDRKYIKDFEFLQRLTEFEKTIGVQFHHIRLLARAFTDRSVGFTHLTLGSNQRLEFLGDTVLQLVVSDRLYRHFPDHHEGHLSLLRSSLVNNRTQAMVCDDLNMSEFAIYNNPKAKPTTKKHKADLLEAFLGALFIDKNLDYCQAFCNACLFPRLQEFIMNQDWNDPKSKLQQCCLTLRSMEGGEPDIPLYKVIECLGPTNTRVYTVGVYFRGTRLAAARGHSIQEAEMNAAEEALKSAHELFPQLDHQKRVIAKSIKKKKGRNSNSPSPSDTLAKRTRLKKRVPKAYRSDKESDSSDESVPAVSDEEVQSAGEKSDDDSGLDSNTESVANEKLDNVQVSSLLSDMQRLKDDLIRRNEYDKLKEKCRRSDSDDG